MSTPTSKSVVDDLRQRIQRLAGAPTHDRAVLPFGIEVIDRVLPGGGLPLGSLHEVAGGGKGAIDGAAAALFTAESQPAPMARCCGA
jgi:protein ImuA